MEEWKDIPEFEGRYQASSIGRIRSVIKITKILNPALTSKGYQVFTLCKNGRQFHRRGHRLVLLAFYGNPPNPQMVCAHINGKPSDNRALNLRWSTSLDNTKDRRRHGTYGMKLNERVAKEILSSILSNVELAKKFSVTRQLIRDIRARKYWKHIDSDL